MSIICNNCGQCLPDDAVFCTNCGTKVTALRCAGCGTVLADDTKFCPNCGTPIGQPTTLAELDIPVKLTHQTAKVRDTPVEPEIGPGKASPSQTAVVYAPKQNPRRFEWKYWGVSILRGYGTTRNSVEVTDEDVVITSKLNKRAIYDATTVPLKNIASVEVWEKVSLIATLMVTILTGSFAGLVVLSMFGMTAIDFGTAEGIGTILCLALIVALVVISGFFRMHHWRITIKTSKEPEYMIYELSAKPSNQRLLFQIQDEILSRAGIQGEPVRKKSRKLVPTIVISAFVLVLAAFVAFQELYQIRALPEKILSGKETRATAWIEMRGDLVPDDCDIIAEITGGRLVKPTAVPRYEDGSFLYQSVKYIYDITLSNSIGESVSGTVTATSGFSVKPFHNQPDAVLFDSFTYSDELTDFAAQQQTLPDVRTGYWIYDPEDLISTAVEEEILAQCH